MARKNKREKNREIERGEKGGGGFEGGQEETKKLEEEEAKGV